eukprot:3958598-Amphidinium_carterae.1
MQNVPPARYSADAETMRKVTILQQQSAQVTDPAIRASCMMAYRMLRDQTFIPEAMTKLLSLVRMYKTPKSHLLKDTQLVHLGMVRQRAGRRLVIAANTRRMSLIQLMVNEYLLRALPLEERAS